MNVISITMFQPIIDSRPLVASEKVTTGVIDFHVPTTATPGQGHAAPLLDRMSANTDGITLPAVIMVVGRQLLAFRFLAGDDAMFVHDDLARQFAIKPWQLHALAHDDGAQWQDTLSRWQKKLLQQVLPQQQPSHLPDAEHLPLGATNNNDAADSVNIRLIGSDFQQRVWRALLTIPFASTWSYRDMAKAVNSHHRAVGSGALKRNPICFFIPCHRVIASNGSLGGYGGNGDNGRAIKQQLLQWERSLRPSLL